VNADLPKNPFSTRFTRPEAVAFQCPVGGGVADHDIAFSEHYPAVVPQSLREASAESYCLREHESAETVELCHRIIRQLKSTGCGLIVGPHGSGKTTLLYTLMPFLISAFQSDGLAQVRRMQLTTPLVNTAWTRFRHARESVHAAVDCLRALEPGSLLVIDGVEQLRSRDLRSLLRKSQRRDVFLLATSHARVAGLSILHQTTVDVMLIQMLADRLLEDASPSVVEIVSRELQGRDLDECTNVRDLWFELYDIVQDELLVDPMNLKV
jgi:energy-coupling factor transporter ATP-binding protein EcfA2